MKARLVLCIHYHGEGGGRRVQDGEHVCTHGAQRQQPTRLLVPGDSPGKNTGMGCHFLLQCMKVKSAETPWIAAHQASLSITISWSLLKHMSTESVMSGVRY